MNKYTVIYTERWQTGSHWHALTKAKRIETKNNKEIMKVAIEQCGTEDIQYIFNGHPTFVGEEVVDNGVGNASIVGS